MQIKPIILFQDTIGVIAEVEKSFVVIKVIKENLIVIKKI